MNCLIIRTGKIIKCIHGQTHEQVCKFTLKTTLLRFLRSGIRIRIFNRRDDSILVAESNNRPAAKQTGIINGILRKNEIYMLITQFNDNYERKSNFTRPIRRM